MTQRVFDIENEKDYTDLWDIVPEEIETIYKDSKGFPVYFIKSSEIDGVIPCPVGLIKINWHDKNKITRPIQEATEQDIGKICAFWDGDNNRVFYGTLFQIDNRFSPHKYQAKGNVGYIHCRRLTKQEIEELC